MNNQKRLELLRQRNLDLSKKLQDTQKLLNEIKNDDTKKQEKIDSLIYELEKIQKEFSAVLIDLEKAKDRYLKLNQELIEIKKNFSIYRLPWYRKL